jgi:hypothetical protein
MLGKKQLTFSARDFYNKCFQFVENGVIYKYASAVSNSEDEHPKNSKDTIRGEMLFSMTKCYRGAD